MRKYIINILMSLLIIGIIIFFLKSEKNQTNQIILYGNIDIRQIDISFKVSGTLKEMLFEEGDHVNKGDLLAILDDQDYQYNYDKANAELKRAKAQLAEAQSLLNTNLPLCKQKIASERSCISYTNAKNEAEAAVEAAKIAAQYQKKQLEYTKIYAPDNGIITNRVQEPGSTLAIGQIIYTLAKDSPKYARVYLPETKLALIDYGTRATIITDTIDPKTGRKKNYSGYVGYISPIAEFTPKNVQTEELRANLVYRLNVYADDANRFLKQGMPVTVILHLIDLETQDGQTIYN